MPFDLTPEPQWIDDRCAACEHPSESHNAGRGKCYRCSAEHRCANFIAKQPLWNISEYQGHGRWLHTLHGTHDKLNTTGAFNANRVLWVDNDPNAPPCSNCETGCKGRY